MVARFADSSVAPATMDAFADKELRIDYDVGNNPIYVAYAVKDTATSSADWLIYKMTYDGSDNLTRRQLASNAFDQVYDDRVSLF